jgi:hypothetical protein
MDPEKYAQRPDSIKQLRSCKTCKLVKSYSQFHASFCDNCVFEWPEQHSSAARTEYVESNTTLDFEGLVSLFQHHGSWVARWLDMQAKDEDQKPLKPGIYAISLPMESAHDTAEMEDAQFSGDIAGYSENGADGDNAMVLRHGEDASSESSDDLSGDSSSGDSDDE